MTDTPTEVPNVVNLDEAVVPLRITHQIFDRLAAKARFAGFDSVEKYCVFILLKSLEERVGAPSIDSPSNFSGENDTKKITGPSGSGMVKRG